MSELEEPAISVIPESGKNASRNLPWIEKYRPKTLDDLVCHQNIIQTINRFIEKSQLPHLLFYGSAGTGKTSTILAIAKQLYKPNEFNSMVLELNASDERGINVVREQIQNFASTRTMFQNNFKLIILDEADHMTKDAQNALRRIMEKFTESTRFCLICNYLSKIIPALQSRCTRFRFAPLAGGEMERMVEKIIAQEGMVTEPDAVKAIVRLANGDMRRAINTLQSIDMAFDKLTVENIHLCLGHPLPKDIDFIMNCLMNEPITQCYDRINEVKIRKGLALQDILTEVHKFVQKVDFPDDTRIYLLDKLAEIESRSAAGANEKILLGALIAAFYGCKTGVLQHLDENNMH